MAATKKMPWVETLGQIGTPLSKEEIEFLQDIKAFIDYGIRNGVTLLSIMAAVTHDVNELARDGFDFQAARMRGFYPKVSGYSKILSESFKDAEEE